MENFKLWLRVWTLKVKSAETLFQRHSCNQNWLWTLTQAGEDTAVFGSFIVSWAEWEVDRKTSGQEMQLWKIWDTSPVQTVCTGCKRKLLHPGWLPRLTGRGQQRSFIVFVGKRCVTVSRTVGAIEGYFFHTGRRRRRRVPLWNVVSCVEEVNLSLKEFSEAL